VHIVKSVGVLSVAKIMGLLYACMGLLFVPFFLLFGMLGTLVTPDRNPFAGVFGVVMAIFMPVLYGIFGFIAGAIGSLLYNLLAKLLGGFQLELEVLPTLTAPYPVVPPSAPASNV
jgi:hypothetical protein